MEELKVRLKGTWASGDFGKVAESYYAGSVEFIDRLNIKKGERVLDIACGTGNLAIPAAKHGADVVGIDIVPNLIEQAKSRAMAEGLKIRFEVGDAEALPVGDADYDTVVTMFGAIFAPRPEIVTAEMLRVVRPGGRIVMANWTPTSFTGQMLKIVSSFAPPSPLMQPPVQWGDATKVRERFGAGVSSLSCVPRTIEMRFNDMDPPEVVEFFRKYLGPAVRAFEALEGNPEKQKELRQELEQNVAKHNKAKPGNTCIESEYLEVTAVKA